MKGNYTTPTGETKTVVDFDEINKMACVSEDGATNKWYHEPEYSTWVKEGDEVVLEEEATEELVEEKAPVKKKATPKKKDK